MKPLALIAVVVLIFWAGLYPFDFARSNGVSPGGLDIGLKFEQFGLLYSQAEFLWYSDSEPPALTIEIWLRPLITEDAEPRSFLAFVDDTELTPLGIRQEGGDLVIWDAVTNPAGDRWYNDFRAPNAFRSNELHHIVLVSGSDGPHIYLNGTPSETTGGFGIPFARRGESLGGTLVVGSGPPWDVGWSGQILAVSLHEYAWTPEYVQQRASAPPGSYSDKVTNPEETLAAYRFIDQKELVDEVQAHSGYDLINPEYYHPPGRRVLTPINLKDWRTGWNTWDALLNLTGFACLGFMMSAVSVGRKSHFRDLALIVCAGFLISLTFELTQSLMVSRSSSLQDLVLNTLGMLFGGLIHIRAGRRKTARFRSK